MKKIILFLTIVIVLASCSSNTSGLQDLDLMNKNVPLKLKAPEGAKVNVKDMGVFKDITIKEGESFYLQITGGSKYANTAEERKAEELETIKQLALFSRVIQEDNDGFIYEKKKGDKLSYDFRRIKIVGDDEYLFQTGLIGNFALKDVETMFAATK